ncbi:uncharacterized protein LOC131159736 [Malania oleifera]|uniref:uncharacterized protein LOC131159736 n=1 Tax=Malania oleifera TaxID=397392 RepID=UPI0025AE7355|nr:uncharacterized protein LOC131159736 [Malania oleifera]
MWFPVRVWDQQSRIPARVRPRLVLVKIGGVLDLLFGIGDRLMFLLGLKDLLKLFLLWLVQRINEMRDVISLLLEQSDGGCSFLIGKESACIYACDAILLGMVNLPKTT